MIVQTSAIVAALGAALTIWAVVVADDGRPDRALEGPIVALDGAHVGRPAPDFELRDLDGRPVSLSGLRGKAVFLNFWATWCPPCVDEMPSLRRLSRAMRGRPFVLVAVSADDDDDALRQFLQVAGFTAEDAVILRDPAQSVAHAYGTRLLPETYAIDREGQVIARFMGARDWAAEDALRLFDALAR